MTQSAEHRDEEQKTHAPNPIAPWELRIEACERIMTLRGILNRRLSS